MDLFRKPFNSALLLFPALVLVGFYLDLGFSHSHSHDHDHYHCGVNGHAHAHHHHHQNDDAKERTVLPEELAEEEEDFKLYGFGYPHDHHCYSEDKELLGLALWLNALDCSFLVSMASVICLIILPVIFVQGKPSKGVADSLALFGEGAMLGGAFLHQLPHAFDLNALIKRFVELQSHLVFVDPSLFPPKVMGAFLFSLLLIFLIGRSFFLTSQFGNLQFTKVKSFL